MYICLQREEIKYQFAKKHNKYLVSMGNFD